MITGHTHTTNIEQITKPLMITGHTHTTLNINRYQSH